MKRSKLPSSYKVFKIWAFITKVAAKNDSSLNLQQKMRDLKIQCETDKNKWLDVTNFMSGSSSNAVKYYDRNYNDNF